MVLCWIALPIFAILGIFSARYRKLTIDAFDCLFKTVTFRKCTAGLDDRLRSDLTARVMKVSPRTAGFVYKNYRLLSWIFLALLIWSTYVSAVGIYNYAAYGNCNGPDSTGFCIFDPFGSNSEVSEVCVVEDLNVDGNGKLPGINHNDPIIGPENAELTIIEFGCYSCPYTKAAESIIKEVLEYYEGRVNLQFRDFPLENHGLSYESSLAASCAFEQGKYLKYHELIFENQEGLNENVLFDIANGAGLDIVNFTNCFEEKRHKEEIELDRTEAISLEVPGTPTFFINDQMIVGPKPFKTFKKIIDKELG